MAAAVKLQSGRITNRNQPDCVFSKKDARFPEQRKQQRNFVAGKSTQCANIEIFTPFCDAKSVISRKKAVSIAHCLSHKRTKKSSIITSRKMVSKKASYRQRQRFKRERATVETRQSRRLSKRSLAIPPLDNTLRRFQVKEDSQSISTTEADSDITPTEHSQRLQSKRSSANSLVNNLASRLKTGTSSRENAIASSKIKPTSADINYVKTRAQKIRYLKYATATKSCPRAGERGSQTKRFSDSKENMLRQKNLGNAAYEQENNEEGLSEEVDEGSVAMLKKKQSPKKRPLRSGIKSRSSDKKAAQKKRKKASFVKRSDSGFMSSEEIESEEEEAGIEDEDETEEDEEEGETEENEEEEEDADTVEEDEEEEDADTVEEDEEEEDADTVEEEEDADTGEEDEEEGILSSEIPTNVVKVYCTHCWPSFSYPWTTAGQTHSSSTGFVWSTEPENRVLLTNAHSVQYAAVVQVRRRGDHQKYEAKVVCVGYDCDLAILTVEEDEFWENMNALKWGNSPRLEDPVTVVGYPVGGDNTSVTQGVVSRIDFQRYTVGSCNLLAIQIDAAINGGNSGGPALNKDKECVGIAFQSLKDSDTENIGYIIPCEVVFHFMEDFARHGMYTGFGSCSFIWQKVENKCMQAYYGLKERNTGILISKIDKTSPAYGLLKKGDIVLSIDDNDIATDGTVAFSNGERIAFEWLLCQKFAGEHIRFSILRSKRHKEIVLPVVRSEPLVPTYLPEEKKPDYFIAGGLVFIPLTELFLTSEYGQDCLCRAPGHLVTASNRFHREFEDEQIVVIGHILAHEITVGYEDFSHYCIREFNGQKIRNLRHLASLIENSTDEFWRFDIDCDMVIVLNAEASRSSIADILKQNMIPAAKSDNLFEK